MSGKPLDDAVYEAPRKGLNHVLVQTVLPIKDLVTGVEMVVKPLSAEMEEEGRQETVRIIGDYWRPRDKYPGA